MKKKLPGSINIKNFMLKYKHFAAKNPPIHQQLQIILHVEKLQTSLDLKKKLIMCK